MNEINVLFLGGAKRVSFAERLIVAGKNMNIGVSIYSYELSKYVPISSVGNVIIGKKWCADDIVDDLISVVQKYSIHIILPFVDPAITIASFIREKCVDVFVPCSDIQICNIMFDKLKANKWFFNNHIPVPKYYSPQTLKNGNVKQTLIFKPRNGSASKGIFIATAKEVLNKIDLNDYLIQDLIENKKEYTVDCYVSKDGSLISIIPRVRLETANGEVLNSVTIRDVRIITVSETILSKGKFRGPITIQFIEDCNTNILYVMEINPRLGGGVIASIAAGGDIPKLILLEALGHQLYPINDWKDNVLMTRYFKEVIFYADNY